MAQKVEKSIQQEIIKSYDNGKKPVDIIKAIETKYNVKVSKTAIYTILKNCREDKKKVVKAVISDELQDKILGDVQLLDNVQSILYKKFQQCIDDEDLFMALKVADQLNKWNDRKLALSSYDGNLDDQSALIDGIMKKFEK